jgi:two-component system CheB/CheR fusion protein
VEDYASGEAFLAAYRPDREACLLLDAYLPGMSGLDVLHRLRETAAPVPTMVITGRSDVAMAVQAMKAGAQDFIEKPISRADLLAGIARALEHARDRSARVAWRAAAATRIAGLTARQREIMGRVLAGQPSKNIAADLGISQRTVENHRAEIMKRSGVRSLPALARLAAAADEPAPES